MIVSSLIVITSAFCICKKGKVKDETSKKIVKPMEVKLRSKMSHWPKIPHRYGPVVCHIYLFRHNFWILNQIREYSNPPHINWNFGPDKNWTKCSTVGCHGVRTLNFPRDKDWLLWAHLLWNVSSWMIAITIAYSEVLRQKAEIELNFCFGDNWKCFLDKKNCCNRVFYKFSCFSKVLLSNQFDQNITI